MIIAWDLDGVINDGIAAGRYIWLDRLAKEYQLNGADFAAYVFQNPYWDNALLGFQDVHVRVSEWLNANNRVDRVGDIISCWHHNDVHFDRSVFEVVDECRAKGHQNILVSNQDKTRCNFISNLSEIEDRFDDIFCSSQLHLKKCNPAFYARIENELCPKRDCRFVLIDDDFGNTRAALSRGWDAFWVDVGSRIRKSTNIQNFLDRLI